MQEDIIYYNVSLVCKKQNQTDPDVKAQFQEGRQTAILSDAKNYTFSIVKFTLDSNNMPILIPKIQTGQNDINLTTYGMMLSYDNAVNAISPPCYLEYDCRNKYFQNIVSSPLVQQQDDPYYYMMNINHFVDMFNDTIGQCYDYVKQQVSSLSGNSPLLKYNGDNTFSLYFETSDFVSANNFNVYFNDDLYNLLRNFNYTNVSNNGFNKKVLISKNSSLSVQTLNNIDYFVEKQAYPSMNNWSPVQSIVFKTNVLGVNPEKVSAPVVLSSNSTIYNQNVNNSDDILTDITLPLENPQDYNSLINYTASVYREANIIQDKIQKLDLIVNWKNKNNGLLYDVLLSDGDSITAKIKFQKIK